MTTTMQLIAKQTVGAAGASSITFSNIPQTYTDLKIVASTRSVASSNGDSFRVYFNGDTANISVIELRGSGSATASYTVSYAQAGYTTDALITSNVFNNAEIYIPNYTSSNNKSSSADNVMENNATFAFSVMSARLWSSSSAVTSITVKPNDAGFAEFSTVYLYGISNSTTVQATTVPFASGGDVIATDGTYWYHAFRNSGSFTPLKALTADVLVVAGGGGGGYSAGGGGGAGSLLYTASQALTNNINYVCSIGAGGVGGLSTGNTQTNGANSTFIGTSLTLTATGGGAGGGGPLGQNGANGGNGGGASGGNTTSSTGGTASLGFAGGSTSASGSNGGAGGGGAGAVGTSISSSALGGSGGNGVNTYSSWATATSTGANSGYYAGGGGGAGRNTGAGGGAGGLGGGGNGEATGANTQTAGTANTGGGGGGSSTTGNNAKDGGSGIIIVRYAV